MVPAHRFHRQDQSLRNNALQWFNKKTEKKTRKTHNNEKNKKEEEKKKEEKKNKKEEEKKKDRDQEARGACWQGKARQGKADRSFDPRR